MYAIIDSQTKKISKNYAVIDGINRKISKIYGVIDGVTRLVWSENAIDYPFTGIVTANQTTGCIMRTIHNNGAFSDFEQFSPYSLSEEGLLGITFGKGGMYSVHAPLYTKSTSSSPWFSTLDYYDKDRNKICSGSSWEMYCSFIPPAEYAGTLSPQYGYITDDNKYFLTIMGLYKPDKSLMDPSDIPCTIYPEAHQLALALFKIDPDSFYIPMISLKSLYSLNDYRGGTNSYWGNFNTLTTYKYRSVLLDVKVSWGDGIVVIQPDTYNSSRRDRLMYYTIDEDDVIQANTFTGYSISNSPYYLKCSGSYFLRSDVTEVDSGDNEYHSGIYYATKGVGKLTYIIEFDMNYSTIYRDIYYDSYTNLLLCISGAIICAYKIDNGTLTKLASYNAGNAYLTDIFGVTWSGVIGCITSSSMKNLQLFQMIYDGEECVITSFDGNLPTSLSSQYLMNQTKNSMTFYDPNNI